MCAKYWLPASGGLPRNSVDRITDRPDMTSAVDRGCKALTQTQKNNVLFSSLPWLCSLLLGETPYQCELCGEAFHRNDKLKRHMRSRHNRLVNKDGQNVMTHIVTTRRAGQHGTPVIIKHEQALGGQDDLPQGELQIVQGEGAEGTSNELHVDVIQENSPQVFLIGLGNEGGETTYLQETQVIEGPDGTRYIIAGSGEELQVFETPDIQQIQEGDVIQNGGETFTVLEQSDQETLTTLANMASVAEIADVVQ